MRALVFGVTPEPPTEALPADANPLLVNLQNTFMAVQDLPDPRPLLPDWVVLRTRLTGICGSDVKQVFMDTGGDSTDFSLTAMITFPQVLGHEVVAEVVELGPGARGLDVGERVVLNPWLSCGPRGVIPPCPACAAGDYSLCWSFTTGPIAAGIHVGNSSDATGGFAGMLPAHDSMVIPVPEGIADEVAVLADPFAVSLHAITRNAPPPHSRAVVWGAGALGLTHVAILRALYPTVEVACVARTDAQRALASTFGASLVVPSEQETEAIVVALADWSSSVLHRPWEGLPFAHPGHVHSVYDTIGAPITIEMALRVLEARGQIVVSGVYAPARFEWSPWYFKEARLVGSNAFGIASGDGVLKHAIEHYLDLVSDGRIDVAAMLTHTFLLEEWRAAFTAIADQQATGAVKVAFDFR